MMFAAISSAVGLPTNNTPVEFLALPGSVKPSSFLRRLAPFTFLGAIHLAKLQAVIILVLLAKTRGEVSRVYLKNLTKSV
jgi:hypothetical protein